MDFGVGYADGLGVEDEFDAGGVAWYRRQCVWEEFHDFEGWVDRKFVVEGLKVSSV